MKSLDYFFTKDEFLKALEQVSCQIGLGELKKVKENHVSKTSNSEKRMRFKEVSELLNKGAPAYRVEYIGYDTHLRFKIGKDHYITRLLDLNGRVLLETELRQQNSPGELPEIGEHLPRTLIRTSLYTDDSLAVELFSIMQNYVERKKGNFRELVLV